MCMSSAEEARQSEPNLTARLFSNPEAADYRLQLEVAGNNSSSSFSSKYRALPRQPHLPWSVVVLGSRRPFLLPAYHTCRDSSMVLDFLQGRVATVLQGQPPSQGLPTVTLPTSLVPAMEVFTTGMWSASSASNTLHTTETVAQAAAPRD